MQVVKIKNINVNCHKNKKFLVKGRIKPFPSVVEFLNGTGVRMIAVLFDKTSCIQLVAFNNDCEIIMEKIQTFSIISIANPSLIVNNKGQITNHKYHLGLDSKTIITHISDNAESLEDFPHECLFIKGTLLPSLKPGTFIDVVGKLTQISDLVMHETYSSRKKYGALLVDSFEIRVVFFREKADDLYEVGSTLKLYNAQYEFKRGDVLDVKDFTTVVVPSQEEIQNVMLDLKKHILQITVKEENDPTLHNIKEEFQVPKLLANEANQKLPTSSVLTSNASTSNASTLNGSTSNASTLNGSTSNGSTLHVSTSNSTTSHAPSSSSFTSSNPVPKFLANEANRKLSTSSALTSNASTSNASTLNAPTSNGLTSNASTLNVPTTNSTTSSAPTSSSFTSSDPVPKFLANEANRKLSTSSALTSNASTLNGSTSNGSNLNVSTSNSTTSSSFTSSDLVPKLLANEANQKLPTSSALTSNASTSNASILNGSTSSNGSTSNTSTLNAPTSSAPTSSSFTSLDPVPEFLANETNQKPSNSSALISNGSTLNASTSNVSTLNVSTSNSTTSSALTSSSSTSSDPDTNQTFAEQCSPSISNTLTPQIVNSNQLLLKRKVCQTNGTDEEESMVNKKLKTSDRFISCMLKLMDDFQYTDKVDLQMRILQLILDEREMKRL